MADLQALQAFAAAHGFQLTHPLTHHQVVTLAEYWLPEVRFHPDERFHPISLAERIDMVEGQFQEFPRRSSRSGGCGSWSGPKTTPDGSACLILPC